MAGVAVAFMSYANDLSKEGNEWYRKAQIAWTFTFEYTLAIVTVGAFVPLLRMKLGAEPWISRTMLLGLGWGLFTALGLMFLGFWLLIKAEYSSQALFGSILGFFLFTASISIYGFYN